jgi:seryl-tRNA synthetase
MYKTGDRPRDFIEAAIIDLKKKPKATKFSGHRRISLFAHTARLKRNLRAYLEISLELEE